MGSTRIIPRKLDAAGTCSSCENDAQSEFMTCDRCLERFHVINCTAHKDEDQCTNTFLRGWANILSKYPNFSYTCDDCREKIKLDNEDILVNRLSVMEQNISYLVQEVKSMQEKASNPTSDTIPATTIRSYADTIKNKPEVIVIEKKQDQDPATHESNMAKLKDAASQSSAGVLRTYKNSAENFVLVCRNKSSKDKLLPHVNNIFSEHKVSTPPAKLPTVTIKDLNINTTKEELFEAVQKQNTENGLPEVTTETFNILFLKIVKGSNQYPDTQQAVVRVSEQIRDSLKTLGDRVYMDLQSCRVVNRLFVRRCNHCQQFKHFHRECKETHSVCGKCGDRHDTRECLSTTKSCINCKNNGYTPVDHETSWYKCPSYLKEQEKLERSIPYYKEKN